MCSNVTARLQQKPSRVTLFLKSLCLLSMCTQIVAIIAIKNSGDTFCRDGETFQNGVIREVSENNFVVVCDLGFELSTNDVLKCRDGFVDVDELPICSTVSPTIRKIRSTDVEQHAGGRHRQKKVDIARRLQQRRKNRRRKQGGGHFQADEGAASMPGEAVQWRSYGNDVVGNVLFPILTIMEHS